MLLTASNIFSNTTSATVSIGASSDDVSDLFEPDFSLNYTSSLSDSMTIDFGVTASEITYIAVAGLNIAGNGDGTSFVRVLDGAEIVATTFLKRNHCVVLNFAPRVFTDLKLQITNGTQDKLISLAYISSGITLTVPNNGETSGYNRHWLNRQIKTKTTTNQLSAPVTTLRKPIAVKGTLNIPNMLASFSQEDYQDFLDFAVIDLFFIQEDETKGESSYCCFEITPRAPRAHSSTRELNNISFSFKVFNGL